MAFWDCSSLKSVSFSGCDLLNIGAYAFEGCVGLTSISIPQGVYKIEKSAFSGCTALKSVTLPDSLQIIDRYAFGDCNALESITIPAGVETIDLYAFSSGAATEGYLKRICFKGTKKQWKKLIKKAKKQRFNRTDVKKVPLTTAEIHFDWKE